jgi:hypothetical protein
MLQATPRVVVAMTQGDNSISNASYCYPDDRLASFYCVSFQDLAAI